jgi:hypothetical protein
MVPRFWNELMKLDGAVGSRDKLAAGTYRVKTCENAMKRIFTSGISGSFEARRLRYSSYLARNVLSRVEIHSESKELTRKYWSFVVKLRFFLLELKNTLGFYTLEYEDNWKYVVRE